MAATAPVLAAPTAAAQPAKQPGTAAVKQANDTISNLLKQKVAAGSKEEKELAAKVTTSVRNFLDIDELGKAAMVDHWAKLSKAQQDEYLKTLRALIEANYINGLRANLAYKVDYVGEAAKDGKTVVNTKVTAQRKGRPLTIAIDYVLVPSGGSLRAMDVVTDGVGLVDNYRTMFNKIMNEKGFGVLIQKMKDKLAQINAQAAANANGGAAGSGSAAPAPAPKKS
ncbi:MAG TPA: ABC transporter substrate-binding protein [Kofleriaceae bacterium]|nr:ABC transporter substrate-binding protein [Kofleriaceae bacterium]